MNNAIALSHALVAAGFTQAQAEAVIQVVEVYTNENLATKIDVARLDGKIDKVDGQGKIAIGLILGLYVALITPHIASL